MTSETTRLEIIGPDKEQSLASSGVRIDRDHWNAGAHRCVDTRPNHGFIGNCDKNASRFRRGRLLQLSEFGLRIIVFWANNLGCYLVFRSRLAKSFGTSLPIWERHVHADEIKRLFLRMPFTATCECDPDRQ